MAVYNIETQQVILKEQHLYGSSRLGINNRKVNMTNITADSTVTSVGNQTATSFIFDRGNKLFELSNHLGNVLVTITDKKIAVLNTNGTAISFYTADVVSANDYYPFGMQMPGRTYTAAGAEGYRYGFNGKELDKETTSTTTYDYGFRIYSPALGRFFSVDPLAHVQPDKTPYHFVSNNPINRIDPTGMLDEWVEKDGQMMYDNRVTNQEDATALYGEGATYRPNGYTYTASNGANIELGDYGFFKSNGQINSSPDLAQNSLAYTNPTQSMANAQSQIAGVGEIIQLLQE